MMFVSIGYEGCCVCRADSRLYSTYSASPRSIKPTVLIRLLGLHTATGGEGAYVDIEVTRGEYERFAFFRSIGQYQTVMI
jgi:hypothetical protein